MAKFFKLSPFSTLFWTSPRQSRAVIKALGVGVVLLLCLLAVLEHQIMTTPRPPSPPKPSHRILVLYDAATSETASGYIYAVELANLLGHFEAENTLLPVTRYTAQAMETYDAVFYVGSIYNATIPSAFFDDILKTGKPVGWIGYNLWKLFAHKPAVATIPTARQRYGFESHKLGSFQPEPMAVGYHGATFLCPAQATDLIQIAIVDPARCQVAATISDKNHTQPYLIQSGRFWALAENPFRYSSDCDRGLVLAEALHDILGIAHHHQQRAFLRIEDVTPLADPLKLRMIADMLAEQKIPFGICVIPVYRDPLKFYSQGERVALSDRPAVVAALKYMVDKGGQIILHGYTHQYEGLKNPYSGLSASDFEFYRVELDAAGRQSFKGPVPKDSQEWAWRRLNLATLELAENGLQAVAWNTPHYSASQTDYRVFAEYFPWQVDRGLFFADQNSTNGQQQFIPYLTKDVYGIRRIPETLGYVDPTGEYQGSPNLVDDLARKAKLLKSVRDSWAGFYFHWFLDLRDLKKTIETLKADNWKFGGIPASPSHHDTKKAPGVSPGP